MSLRSGFKSCFPVSVGLRELGSLPAFVFLTCEVNDGAVRINEILYMV